MDSFKQFAIYLHSFYYPGFEFPLWTIDFSIPQFNKTKTCLLYLYDSTENKTITKNKATKLLIEREPCNIGMERYYNQSKMKNYFGWDKGAYQLSKLTKLMPNIAVSCETTVIHPDDSNIKKNVCVINLIGLALDNKKQPDYLFIKNIKKEKRLQFIEEFYYNMWRLAIKDAINRGLDKIVYWYIGAGAFSTYLPELIEEFNNKSNFVQLLKKQLYKARKYYNKNITLIDGNEKKLFVPGCLFKHDDKNTLYVNAWDPWSIVGNGNFNDNSLDGYWGRYSDMALRCWPVTNKYIKIEGIKRLKV